MGGRHLEEIGEVANAQVIVLRPHIEQKYRVIRIIVQPVDPAPSILQFYLLLPYSKIMQAIGRASINLREYGPMSPSLKYQPAGASAWEPHA